MRSLTVLLGTLLLLAAAPGFADEPAPAELPMKLQIHGFVSQGFILSTDNNFLVDSSDGSFEFAEAGLNLTVPLTDKLRAGMQLFAFDLGAQGNYRMSMDWFYLDYHLRDWFGLRAGRLKLPFGLYNDTADIDAARSVVLLPQSVYPPQNRNFLLAQDGAEIYGYYRLGGAGALDYRVYGGAISLDLGDQSGSAVVVRSLRIPFVVGARLLWELPVPGLRLGGSIQLLRLDADIVFPMATGPVTINIYPALLWVGSLEYTANDLLIAAEYGRWHVETDSNNAMLFPPSTTDSERAYALVAYRLTPWLQATGYYSLYYPDVDSRSGNAAMQHDVAATVRFDVNAYWIIKLEGHFIHGTAGLSPALNDNRPASMLEPDWGLFLVKTTAYF